MEFCIPKESAQEFGDTKQGILRQIIKACNKKSLTDLKNAVATFNEKLVQTVSSLNQDNLLVTANSLEFTCHVLEQSYSRTVAPVSHLLSKTKGFSNTVYGEVKPNLVNEFIGVTNLTNECTFLDMVSSLLV